jgi:hypothetical protein
MAQAVARGWLAGALVAALGRSAAGQVDLVSHTGGSCQEYPETGAFAGMSYCAGVGLAGTRVFMFDGASDRSSSFTARDAALNTWLSPIESAAKALATPECVEMFRLLACYAWYVNDLLVKGWRPAGAVGLLPVMCCCMRAAFPRSRSQLATLALPAWVGCVCRRSLTSFSRPLSLSLTTSKGTRRVAARRVTGRCCPA